MSTNFGALAFLGDAGGAGGQTVLRRVVYSGGFNYAAGLFGSINVNTYHDAIVKAFTDAGWSINNLAFSQASIFDIGIFSATANEVGFTLDINLSSNYSANDGRLAAKSLLENLQGLGAISSPITDVYIQIVSDAGVSISQNIQAAASTPAPNVVSTVQNAAVKTANQVATQGVIPVAAQGLDSLLFGGQTFDVFGLKIPKLIAYGVVALVGIPIAMDLIEGKRR